MAVRSGFWNSSGSDIRRYYNSDFSHLISLLINDGVSQNYGDSLIPTTGNGMTVVIQTGEAWFNDIWLRNDTDLVIDIDAAPIVNNYSRLDAIAIKIDASSGVRDATIVYKAGTPTAGTPTLPEMVDTADVHWHMLASVLVKTNDTSIPRERITNYVGSSTTPLITGLIETISAEDLIQQWQAEFNSWNSNKQAEFEAWVETIQGILDEEAAGHLQLEIEDLYSKTHTNFIDVFAEDQLASGVQLTSNYDGTYKLSGRASADVYFDITDPRTPIETHWPKLKAGKYKIVGDNQSNGVTLYVQETNTEGTLSTGVFEVANDNTPYRVRLKIDNGTVLNGLTVKPMLTSNLSATYDDFIQYSGNGEVNENLVSLYKNKQDATSDFLITSNKTITGAINELVSSIRELVSNKLGKTETAANATKWADWIADIMTENQNVTWVTAVGPDAKIQHRYIPLAYNTEAPTLKGLTVNGDTWYNNGQVTVNRTDNWYNWHFLAMRGDTRLFHTQYTDFNSGYNENSKRGYTLISEQGDLIFQAPQTGIFHFFGSGHYSGVWTQTSSRRHKKNIVDISEENALKLLELNPVEFDFKESEIHSHGLIAEDVSEVMPDMVIYNKDGEIEGIDYTQFVSHLIKLCQIQQKQIDELEKRVEALENKKATNDSNS